MRLCRQYMLLNTEKIPLSLTLGLHRYQKSFSTSNFDPLRILFCGSEEFSIYSLSALYNEQRRDPGSIASIDVVCRPGKPVGRGLQKVREGEDLA